MHGHAFLHVIDYTLCQQIVDSQSNSVRQSMYAAHLRFINAYSMHSNTSMYIHVYIRINNISLGPRPSNRSCGWITSPLRRKSFCVAVMKSIRLEGLGPRLVYIAADVSRSPFFKNAWT